MLSFLLRRGKARSRDNIKQGAVMAGKYRDGVAQLSHEVQIVPGGLHVELHSLHRLEKRIGNPVRTAGGTIPYHSILPLMAEQLFGYLTAD